MDSYLKNFDGSENYIDRHFEAVVSNKKIIKQERIDNNELDDIDIHLSKRIKIESEEFAEIVKQIENSKCKEIGGQIGGGDEKKNYTY